MAIYTENLNLDKNESMFHTQQMVAQEAALHAAKSLDKMYGLVTQKGAIDISVSKLIKSRPIKKKLHGSISLS